jgi:hypothetical protein
LRAWKKSASETEDALPRWEARTTCGSDLDRSAIQAIGHELSGIPRWALQTCRLPAGQNSGYVGLPTTVLRALASELAPRLAIQELLVR